MKQQLLLTSFLMIAGAAIGQVCQPNDIPVTAGQPMVCTGDSTTIDLSGTDSCTYYTIRRSDNSVLAGPVQGVTGALSFNSDPLISPETYHVDAQLAKDILSLDGTADYVSVMDTVIPMSGAFTLEIWARQNNPQTGFVELVSQNGSSPNQFYFGHSSTGEIRAGNSWISTGANFPTDGLWHHYTLVNDTSSATIYMDGNVVASLGTPIANPSTAATVEFKIGAQFGAIGEYFNGSYAHVSVWDYAKNQAAIQADMDSCHTGQEAGLIALYSFKDGAGTTVTDLTNAHSGTLEDPDNSAYWSKDSSICIDCQITLSDLVSIGISNDTTVNQSFSGCDSINFNSTWFTQDTVVTDFYMNQYGCDSTVVTTLDITPIGLTVIENGGVLASSVSGQFYQWVSCPDMTQQPNGNDSTFVPTSNGSYAVIVNNPNGEACTSTSPCYSYTSVSASDIDLDMGLSLYPNPAQELVNVSWGIEQNCELMLLDLNGRLLYSTARTSSPAVLNVQDLEPGTYFLQVRGERALDQQAFIKY